MFDTLVHLLQSQDARFRVIEHPAEGRSDLVAEIRGTAPGQGAKAMLCKSRDAAGAGYPQLFLAVLPGDRKLDFKRLAQAVGVRKATLASPEEAQAATGCVMGSVPPFSFNPQVRLVVDPALVERFAEIAFNAGRLDRSIVLDSADYVRIARPALHSLSGDGAD
ncbi:MULTISPECIES: YbaK/prolyl-tRNA synthetase associated domain-containing protein [Delftia]|uniref:YbaK/prolyl-tRNA synthetase associated domain-containing protein n=1 Tax=Delftia TaxID=80865 RepID=UPI0007744871|nr:MULTISPECIES: YbaK/prolyl-tRNA synthetase associated domain-containing protein [Delftia]MPT50786.1 YbaK/prolyl-tRNA synthetase associated domain-containing protein [Delftia sp.]SFB06762.1 Ala-tRNA(Pro) deacylase [Delftia tsuruhatensis]